MFRSIVFCGALLALLAGCTSSEVKIVKESHLAQYPDFLVGQAFDNRSACGSIDWKSYEDDRKRTVVEYTCQYKFAPEFYKTFTSELLATESQQFERSKATLEGTLEQHKATAASYQKKLEEFQGRPKSTTWEEKTQENKKQLAELKLVKSCEDYLAIKAAWAIKLQDLYRYAESCVAAKNGLSKPFNDALALEIYNLESAVVYDKGRPGFELQMGQQDQNRESGINEYAANIEFENTAIEKLLASKDASILTFGNERDVNSKKYQDQLDNFQSANEKIQWIVMDGKPQLVGIFLVLKTKRGEIQKPAEPRFLLNEIYQNRPETSAVHKSFLKEMWLRQDQTSWR